MPLDKVRVISNLASGETGILLAEGLAQQGARITLLLGPVSRFCPDKRVKTLHFLFFEDLRRLIRQELRRKEYEIIIHSAAVSDFAPERLARGKISSGSSFAIRLRPLPKIIQEIKKYSASSRLVIFKLEADISDRLLIARAVRAQKNAQAEFVVANRLNPYRAFLIQRGKTIFSSRGKVETARKLIKLLSLGKRT